MTGAEIAICIRELLDHYDPVQAQQWMLLPHPHLEGRRPIDCPIAEVIAVLARLV
jgi:uncharacterized protein (DUF2384 family)